MLLNVLSFWLELQRIAFGRFYAAVAPAVAAQGHILVVAAYFHLVAIGDYVPILVDAGIYYGLASARTSALYLVDAVGNLKQPP